MAHGPLVLIFGLLGNIVSFLCFLAPILIFYKVCRRKSTEGFQLIPYVAALFSVMLWIYYAYVKGGEMILITINLFGCVIETIYLAIFLAYCPKNVKLKKFLFSSTIQMSSPRIAYLLKRRPGSHAFEEETTTKATLMVEGQRKIHKLKRRYKHRPQTGGRNCHRTWRCESLNAIAVVRIRKVYHVSLI